jgi:hypothetical protein
MPQAHEIIFARNVQVCLGFIPIKDHRVIRVAILEQLLYTPMLETRNRKPLDPEIYGATWELRCGPQNRYRVLYDVIQHEQDANNTQNNTEPDVIHVLLIGEKIGERLLIAGKVVNDETDFDF